MNESDSSDELEQDMLQHSSAENEIAEENEDDVLFSQPREINSGVNESNSTLVNLNTSVQNNTNLNFFSTWHFFNSHFYFSSIFTSGLNSKKSQINKLFYDNKNSNG